MVASGGFLGFGRWQRAFLAIATALIVGVVAASAAEAAGNTFYAKAGGKPTGATCPLGDECSLPHAESLAGDGDSIVLEPGAAYNPGSLVVDHAVDIGGQAGAAVPNIAGPGSGNAVTLTNAAHLHDVHIVAAGGIALDLGDGSSAERVTAESSGSGNIACNFFAATLTDSVCWAGGASAVVMGGSIGSRISKLNNVTAVSVASGYGILVLATNASAANHFDALNTIAVGENAVPAADVATNGTGGIDASVSLTNSDYTKINVTGPGGITPLGTNGNQTAPPLFANLAGGDFHQLAGSPTIDTGLAAPSIGTLDLDRNPRISTICKGGAAGKPDIGAYEFPTVSPPLAACGVFTIGKLELNKKKGTAKLTVSVPGSGLLTGTGKGLKEASATAGAAGDLVLTLKASGKSKHRLKRKGKVKLNVVLGWTPAGGSATTQTDKVKLVKKRRKKK